MIRKAFKMKVYENEIEEYKKRHNPIWKELEDTLKIYGVHKYSIFFDEETHVLFGYVHNIRDKMGGYFGNRSV